MKLLIYMILMAGVTYLIRVIPFAFFTKKVENRFIKSFLYYVPYAVLSAMTFPAIFYSTGSRATALGGTAVAFALAWQRRSLTTVAMAAALTVLILSFVF